jgi:Protein of unknown function (DUF3455)
MRKVSAARYLSAAVILSLGGCASTAVDSGKGKIGPPDVPAQLRPAAGEVLFLEARGEGVQIYDCSLNAAQPATYEWTFRAPEAQLKDSSGRVLGRHFTGPTWELDDGGSVVGELKARAPSPSPSAIPWLLLSARATAGSGKLTATTSIQRLQTVGGIAPSVGCNAANAGKVARVPYTATYNFYRAAP